jgi:uncharacterized protein involved in outer membrane biogenesis
MVRGIPNVSIPNLSQIAAQGGKMSLPVDSSSLIYSNFEHVSGVLAPKGIQGVSITKINLLDVLIGRLNQVNKSPAPVFPSSQKLSANASREMISESSRTAERFNSLVDSMRNQLKQAKAASDAMPYIPAPNTQPGALFNLLS